MRTRPRHVRDREVAGSNPAPPTIFVFEIGDLRGSTESGEPPGHNFPRSNANRGALGGLSAPDPNSLGSA